MAESNPAVFTANSSGLGLAAALNVAADGSVTYHGSDNPVARGGAVALLATGLGLTVPVLADGALAGAPLPRLDLLVRALVGGQPAPVLYGGPAPGQIAGLMQINIRVPDSVAPGQAALLVVAGENPSQVGVALAIR